MSGGALVGDPVSAAEGNTYLRLNDVALGTSTGDLGINRMYNSNDYGMAPASQPGYTLENVPKPFGSSPFRGVSVRWWHNFFDFVTQPNTTSGLTEVRDAAGGVHQYIGCSGPCWLANWGDSYAQRERLYWDGTQYLFLEGSGFRYAYGAKFLHALVDSSTTTRYFVTQVWNKNGRLVATVSYAQPALSGCQAGLTGSTPGAPYIDKITAPGGEYLKFSYTALTNNSGQTECVISSIAVHNRTSAADETVASYSYQQDGGGVTRPGLISSVTLPDKTITYTNPTNAFVATVSGTEVMHHTYNVSTGWVSSSVNGLAESLTFGPSSLASTLPETVCSFNSPKYVQVTDNNATIGNGSATAVQYLKQYVHLTNANQIHEPRLYYTMDAADGGVAAQGFQASQPQQEWYCNSTIPGVPRARKEANASWTTFDYADAGVATFPQLMELKTVSQGASSIFGAGALEVDQYDYLYGTNSEQLVQNDTQASVLGGTGINAQDHLVYDGADNRLKAMIRSGYTKVRNGSGVWSTQSRLIGIFYFTNNACAGGPVDPLNRVLEVRGPCLVTSQSSTDCDGGGTIPVRQFGYYAAGPGNNQAGRLQTLTRRAAASGTSGCSGGSLTTTFNTYDALGHPTSVTDANGVTATYTYLGAHVSSETISGQTTSYFYDNGKLTRIQHPQGDNEIMCYRTGTPGPGCTGGNWTDKVQWKAKAGSTHADGSAWAEKVSYTYWPNGSLASETFYGACGSGCTPTSGELRKVVKHAVNVLRQPTLVELGTSATPPVRSPRQYSASGKLLAIGFPYNAPPDFCGTIGSASPLCASLSYDRADRLIGLDQFPAAAGAGYRTCMTYDAQGNVSSVKSGCAASGSGGDCSSCCQPSSTYQYDDFDNVVEATLPWTDNGSGAPGVTHYEYDAQGNLLKKETPDMTLSGSYLTYDYDSLDRVSSARSYHSTPSPGFDTLYALAYDASGSLSATCPQPSNTQGRLRVRTDSFGDTWYQYDAWGRVLGEIRLRTGTTSCSGANPNNIPHTFYTYSANGNLTSIIQPFGRVVTYGYVTGGVSNRVASIGVTLDGVPQQVISSVTWEPFGRLRAYQINHPGSANTSGVQYWLGSDSATAPSSGCSVGNASTDYTGRLRSIGVNAGNLDLASSGGSIFQRTYTWTGDQVTRADSCLLGTTTPQVETYGYDGLLRLTAAGRGGDSVATTGGNFNSLAYTYDGRGNLTSLTRGGRTLTGTYGTSGLPDRLTQMTCSGTGCLGSTNYTYDRDGRVASRFGPNDSSSSPTFNISYLHGASASGALDTVLRSVSVNGAIYQYFYDAFNRRRLKAYPDARTDEFFYDAGHNLLVDRGAAGAFDGNYNLIEEYIWLDGRPVAMVRGKRSADFLTSYSDYSTDCSRKDGAECGIWFPVSDNIGKPVLLLDRYRKVAQSMNFEPYGLNRVYSYFDSAHPYPPSTTAQVSTHAQFIDSTHNVKVLYGFYFHLLDTESNGGAPLDYAYVQDMGDNSVLVSSVGGRRGEYWVGWLTPTTTSGVKVMLTSNATNCCPLVGGGLDCTGSCASYPNYPYAGAVVTGYSYQKYEGGSKTIRTPLRFPGHYSDAETGFFENWNRYYDPTTGRYLEPELYAESPRNVRGYAKLGRSLPTYAYALSNPLGFIDPDGDGPLPADPSGLAGC